VGNERPYISFVPDYHHDYPRVVVPMVVPRDLARGRLPSMGEFGRTTAHLWRSSQALGVVPVNTEGL
jgi:hypothetical protein